MKTADEIWNEVKNLQEEFREFCNDTKLKEVFERVKNGSLSFDVYYSFMIEMLEDKYEEGIASAEYAYEGHY